MTVKYSISRWRSMFYERAAEHSVCYRAPRARNELWRMGFSSEVGDMLRGERDFWIHQIKKAKA